MREATQVSAKHARKQYADTPTTYIDSQTSQLMHVLVLSSRGCKNIKTKTKLKLKGSIELCACAQRALS